MNTSDQTLGLHRARDNDTVIDTWCNHKGGNDTFTGISATHVWLALGWHDIRQRYRRSVLGPFWFTLSTLILVSVLGALYSTFLHQEITHYLPYLGIGMVVWQYLSACINEGCLVFIGSSQLIKQIRMPLTIYVMRMVWRNFIILAHSLPILIILTLCFGYVPGPEIVLLLPGLLLLSANCIWIGIVLGILCTRYRDVQPIIGNLLQVAFFFTPIMWTVDLLKERAWIAEFNPLYHLIEIVRGPIIGKPPEILSWLWATGLLLAGMLLVQYLMKRCRDRVPYWL
ncbi:MAG: ABC transporter permease [Azoarcus sp.]|jgi:lipopolysaccharide transport system permease protein|nr:ABC transporter permease [Azoarcus sp.]